MADIKTLSSGKENSKTVLPHPTLMSRFWAKSKDIARSVLRALCLAILAHAFTKLGHLTGRGLHESVKIAIRKDRAIALLRSLIHLIPISVSLCEIILNWNTYYVGVSIYNQAVYQLLAKIHEITIQASLAAVVFSYTTRIDNGKGNSIWCLTIRSSNQPNLLSMVHGVLGYYTISACLTPQEIYASDFSFHLYRSGLIIGTIKRSSFSPTIRLLACR